ncbi:hypothetical protein EPN96_00140 [bacterium]|nr:MAG: hypothetical protein EPN96_00140 [bacterium]
MFRKIIFPAMFTVFTLSGLSFAGEDLSAAKALFEKKCNFCHSMERPLSKNKDRAGWTETVKRMQSKEPDRLSDSDVETIIDYLTAIRGKK